MCLPQTEVPELFSSSCGARAEGGLDCLLGDVFGGRKAKQSSSPAERKAALPWCALAPQVPQPKGDLNLHTIDEADHSCASLKSHLPCTSNPPLPHTVSFEKAVSVGKSVGGCFDVSLHLNCFCV